MRLATLRTEDVTVAARVEGNVVTRLDGFADVGAVLRSGALEQVAEAAGVTEAFDESKLDPVIVDEELARLAD